MTSWEYLHYGKLAKGANKGYFIFILTVRVSPFHRVVTPTVSLLTMHSIEVKCPVISSLLVSQFS